LLAGLQSGEIDLVQQTTGDILLEDYESVKALPNVTVYPGRAITNQSIFFNVNNVPDVRIRQAVLYGIDRNTIFEALLHGNGEIVDAFLCSASPYYSAELGVTEYDPERARRLIAEAKADGADTTLTWYVNGGDATFVQAAAFIQAMFYDLGLNLEIKTVDFATLMSVANSGEAEMLSVQYTYAPVDPYTDMSWMLSEYGWTCYVNEEVSAALLESQNMTDMDEIRANYLFVNRQVQQDVPMISAYIISTIGVTNNRLVGAQPDVFGTFINVHEWDVVQ
jgi:peptide/nickel transport system substrate-binding protein